MAEPIHVLDLPQLYQKPSFDKLQEALSLLSLAPPSFEAITSLTPEPHQAVHPEGIPSYLTSIISSQLRWLPSEEAKEAIWSLASQRLTERSGRTAMGDLTRSFNILTLDGDVSVKLHEPALTGDSLGLKTWSSSFVLAKRLHLLNPPKPPGPNSFILELGAGTGLVGLAAAATWHRHVVLTDLADIEPNIATNIALNADLLAANNGSATSGVLDWTDPTTLTLRPLPETETASTTHSIRSRGKAQIILVADPIYSPDHPRLLLSATLAWLARSDEARFVLAYPLREAYEEQIENLKARLGAAGLVAVEGGVEEVMDDWKEGVVVCWGVWRWGAGLEG